LFIKLRIREPDPMDTANACMMCNRCYDACHVGIDYCRLKEAGSVPSGMKIQLKIEN